MVTELRTPTNTDAEASVLATLLYSPRAIVKVMDTLSPEHFFDDDHAAIYAGMLTLSAQKRACSLLNVCDELTRTNTLEQVGGKSRLQGFIADLDTYGTIEEAASIVTRTYQHRRLYDAARTIATAALHQDEDALERAEELIAAISLGHNTKGVATLSEAIDRYMADLDERRDNFQHGIAAGIPTGLVDLDRMLGGLEKSSLYVLAARPGFGKTSLALTIALFIAKHARHALFFSLEMDEGQIVQRVLASETEIDQSFLRDGDIDESQRHVLENAAKQLRPYDLKIDDRTSLLADIRTKARQVHLRQPLDLIVIDYLQLIDTTPTGQRSRNENRAEEVAKISKSLKKLARELKVPVLALAQMNRDSEKRGNSLPQLSDLGDSSGIEKDSDCVMFIYCNDEQVQRRDDNLPYDLSIIVKKHRNGRMGSVPLRFRPKLTKFQDTEVASYAEADD